jgi:hypothetical protein
MSRMAVKDEKVSPLMKRKLITKTPKEDDIVCDSREKIDFTFDDDITISRNKKVSLAMRTMLPSSKKLYCYQVLETVERCNRNASTSKIYFGPFASESIAEVFMSYMITFNKTNLHGSMSVSVVSNESNGMNKMSYDVIYKDTCSYKSVQRKLKNNIVPYEWVVSMLTNFMEKNYLINFDLCMVHTNIIYIQDKLNMNPGELYLSCRNKNKSSNKIVKDSKSSNKIVKDSKSSNEIVKDSNSSNEIVKDSNSSNEIVKDSNYVVDTKTRTSKELERERVLANMKAKSDAKILEKAYRQAKKAKVRICEVSAVIEVVPLVNTKKEKRSFAKYYDNDLMRGY